MATVRKVRDGSKLTGWKTVSTRQMLDGAYMDTDA
jgi:hypothetical protein